MSTANIINNQKLLDELMGFDSFAALFSNDVGENEENPVFEDPLFEGYKIIQLSKENWGPSVAEGNYSKIEYNEPIVWNNESVEGSHVVKGYYVKNTSGDILWFKVFESPLTVNAGESVSIYPKITLNKYEYLTTTFTFNITNANPNSSFVIDPNFEITQEKWGDIDAEGSLFDVSLSGFVSKSGVVSLGLDQRINPTAENPFSFKVTISQPGFIVFSKDITVEEIGDYEVNVKLIRYG